MGYYNNYLVDNHSCIVVGVQATGARLREESRAAENMIARLAQWQGSKPQSIAADASYGNGEFLQWLMDREITPYMPRYARDGGWAGFRAVADWGFGGVDGAEVHSGRPDSSGIMPPF